MNLSELEDDRHDEAGMVKANDGRRVVPVLGRTMREALLRARRAVGEKAVVVDHREQSGGVLLAVAPEVPRSPAELEELRGEARALLDAKQRRATPERAVAPVSSVPGRSPLAAVERSLRTTGVSRKLRERVLEAVAGRMTESAHPLDLAAEELGAVFSTASLPRDKRTTVIVALLGQTGVGKTTSLAKLGARLVRSGKRVALATMDAWRVGAVEQLKAYGALLGAPAMALRDAALLAREVAQAARFDVILVDGAGDLTRDIDQLRRLRETIESTGAEARLEAFVVLPATASEHSLALVTSTCAVLEPRGVIITKLDEAAMPAPVLEHALSANLPLAFLSDGPDLAVNFHRAAPERIADLLLKGRLA